MAAGGVSDSDSLADHVLRQGVLIGILRNRGVGLVQQSGDGIDGDVGEQLVPDQLHHILVGSGFKAGLTQSVRHLLCIGVGPLQGAHIGDAAAGVAHVARLQEGAAVSGRTTADLLLRHHLGDLIIVADTVLQREHDGVLTDHGLGVFQRVLQQHVLDKYDQQVHRADFAGVCGGVFRRKHSGFTLRLIQTDAVGADRLNMLLPHVADIDLMYLAEVATVKTAHGAAA